MKKTFFFSLIFLLFFSIAISKEYKVESGLKANIYNDILGGFVNQNMHLSYDTEDKKFLLYIDYMIWPIAIEFTDTLRITLLTYIEKYKEWNKKASQKGVKLEKEIGVLPQTTVWFKSGDSWEIDFSVVIHVKFFSQSTQKHQLIIYLETLTSADNKYITNQPEALYFWWKNVVAFEKAIIDESIEDYINEVQEKQNIEEEFK